MPFAPSEPTIPQPGEVQVEVIECHSRISLGHHKVMPTYSVHDSSNNLPVGLERVSIHTYRSFWEEADEYARKLVWRATLHSWTAALLLVLFVVSFIPWLGAVGLLYMNLVMLVLLVVVVCTSDNVATECHCCCNSANDPDDGIAKVAQEYSEKFQNQGFVVDYRKEYETSREAESPCRQMRAVKRFMRFQLTSNANGDDFASDIV